MRSPSYRRGNDVIVHLRWNAPHKRGGKQSGDIDWSIITKPHPSSTQEAWLWLWSVHNAMSYLMILILETVLNVTPWHRPWSLINLTRSLYGEAPSDEVSKRKSPWQQRWPCKCTTYINITVWSMWGGDEQVVGRNQGWCRFGSGGRWRGGAKWWRQGGGEYFEEGEGDKEEVGNRYHT